MFRLLKLLIISVLVYSVPVAPGSAFQFFGGNSNSAGDVSASLEQAGAEKVSPSAPSLDLGEDGTIDPSDSETMNIWIPGIGVVGKMPKLDFGLEMLYGSAPSQKDEPSASEDLGEFESDFAIKGTIKRKF